MRNKGSNELYGASSYFSLKWVFRGALKIPATVLWSSVVLDTLAETAPVLTANSFLKMCRIVYDATSLWKYPDDISAEYIFIEARMNAETIGEGILGIDPDSPEAFAKTFYGIYHREELWFGGPKLFIHDESAKLGERLSIRKLILRKCYRLSGSSIMEKKKNTMLRIPMKK